MGATEHMKPLRIAVLLTFEAQMLDLAGIDLFGMISKEYLEAALPNPIVSLGLDVKVCESKTAHRGLAMNHYTNLRFGRLSC
jgi:hypothetical protein